MESEVCGWACSTLEKRESEVEFCGGFILGVTGKIFLEFGKTDS